MAIVAAAAVAAEAHGGFGSAEMPSDRVPCFRLTNYYLTRWPAALPRPYLAFASPELAGRSCGTRHYTVKLADETMDGRDWW